MVNRTPKRLAALAPAEAEYTDFFTAMKTGDSVVHKPEDKGPDVAAQLQSLIQRVEQLSVQNDVFRSQFQTQQHYAPQNTQVAQPMAQDAIPDPVLDADGYTSWLIKRTDDLATAKIDAFRQEQADQSSSTDAFDRLWTGFLAVDGNKGWEKSPEKVQVAALKVSKKLTGSGIDPTAYMFQNTAKYYADLSKTLEKDFGRPEDEDYEDEPEVDRTAGLMGRQTPPVSRSKGVDDKNVPDLSADLITIQRKGGWY